MRIFLAGASGLIGVRLVPLLVAAGHELAGMTRTPSKVSMLAELGCEPVVCDVYDADALRAAVVGFAPEMVMHQLTDLCLLYTSPSPRDQRGPRMPSSA